MILFSLIMLSIKTYYQFTLYPTSGEQFIYPINKLGIPTGLNYSVNNGWDIMQPLLQEIKEFNQPVISISIGNINGDTNSITNIIGVLTNGSLYLYEQNTSVVKQVITYNSTLQCLDLYITGKSDYTILSCLSNRTITLLQLNNNQLTPIVLDQQYSIENSTLQDSSITFTENGYLLLYMFNNSYQQYLFQSNQNVIVYQGLYQFQSISSYVSFIGSTFILQQKDLSINGMAVVQASSRNFTNMAFLTINYYVQEYLIAILAQDQLQLYLSNSLNQLLYMKTVLLGSIYKDIYITQDYIYLINDQSIDTFTFDNNQLELYSSLPIQFEFILTNQPSNILFVAYINQLTIIRYQDAYITTLGVNQTQNLQINGYDNNDNQFQFQFTSIPIDYNDTNIYLMDNTSYVESQCSQYSINVQNLSVGTNQTYQLQNQISGTQTFNQIYKNVSIIQQKNSLIDLYFSDEDDIWIQVLFNLDNFEFTVTQLQFNYETNKLETILSFISLSNMTAVAINLQIFCLREKNLILLYSTNYSQIYEITMNSTQFIQSIIFRENGIVGIIDQIQIVQDKLYYYFSNFQQIYQYQYQSSNTTGPLLIDIPCLQPILEANQISYPQQLFVGCTGNIYIIQQTYGILGYYVIKSIPINNNAVLAPIEKGMYFYEYNSTYSQLYFIHNLPKLIITKVNSYGLQIDQNITYSYSNRFFYIQEISQTGQIYQSIYQGEYIQQSSQYVSYDNYFVNAQIYQAATYDLVVRYGNSIYIDYIPHFQILHIIPQFNYQLQINISSLYIISNQYSQLQNTINTLFQFNELIIENNQQSIFGSMQNLTYENQSLLGYQFKISDILSGSIQIYNVTCVNCSNLTYIQPIQQIQELDFPSEQSSKILAANDNLYVLTYNQIQLINQQQSINQTIFSDTDSICLNLFIEQNSNDICWVCQNIGNKNVYIYAYNQQTTFTTTTQVGFIIDSLIIQSSYQAPMVQIIFQPNIFFSYYFNIIQTQITLKQIIANQALLMQNYSYYLPISYQSIGNIYYNGLLTYLSKSRLYFFISQLYINNNMAVLINNNQFTISDPLFDFYTPTNQFCGDIVYQQSLNYTIMEFILCGNNPFVLQITMNELQIYDFQILCQINQLNYTNTKFQYNQIQYFNNMITSMMFDTQNQEINLYIYYINQSLCQNREILQPIQYMTIQNQTSKLSTVQFINNNTIALLLNDYVQFYSASYYILTLYQPKSNLNDVMLVIKAINPTSEAITYVQLIKKMQEISRSWLFWFEIYFPASLLIILILGVIIWCYKKKMKEDKIKFEKQLLLNELQTSFNQGN